MKSTYMVHVCNDRLWYVKNFLLPSMIAQGIDPHSILVYQDKNGIGNLRSFIDSCNRLCHNQSVGSSVWHLQDDVCVCSDFAERTFLLDSWSDDNEIICGFSCAYDNAPVAGRFKVYEEKMWFSFPCIRLPMNITRDFTRWANVNLWQSQHFKEAVLRNKYDDLIFREWLIDSHWDCDVLNLAPNLVNHIDDIIGGSVCNKQRDKEQNTRSIFWDDDKLIEDLEKRINEYKLSST